VYSIRTDIHLNIDTNTMVAMLELPGVKHDDLSVTLATEPYTHARQITVAGRTYPPFAEPVPEERERMKRERKFGDFLRRLHVPPRTQEADINAEMKDGVLVLTVHLGAPATAEAPQIITIN
jgi:HSP20 family protein